MYFPEKVNVTRTPHNSEFLDIQAMKNTSHPPIDWMYTTSVEKNFTDLGELNQAGWKSVKIGRPPQLVQVITTKTTVRIYP